MFSMYLIIQLVSYLFTYLFSYLLQFFIHSIIPGISIVVPEKIKVELQYDLALPLLGMYPELSVAYHTNAYTPKVIIALVTTAK